MITNLSELAMGVADSVWNYVETDYLSREELHEEIMGLIFRVSAEALQAKGAHYTNWYHELPLNSWSSLICEYEKVGDSAALYRISYTDDEEDFIMLREWREVDPMWIEG